MLANCSLWGCTNKHDSQVVAASRGERTQMPCDGEDGFCSCFPCESARPCTWQLCYRPLGLLMRLPWCPGMRTLPPFLHLRSSFVLPACSLTSLPLPCGRDHLFIQLFHSPLEFSRERKKHRFCCNCTRVRPFLQAAPGWEALGDTKFTVSLPWGLCWLFQAGGRPHHASGLLNTSSKISQPPLSRCWGNGHAHN